MNRRDFLKSSSVAIAAATVYLPDIFTERLPSEYVNPAQWFTENKEWLKEWFLKSDKKFYRDPFVIEKLRARPMQIFRTDGITMETYEASNRFEKEYLIERIAPPLLSDLKDMHWDSILVTCIFGIEQISSGVTGEGYPAPRCMSGFFEQTGRYPTKKDKILVQCLRLFDKMDYNKYFDFQTTAFISELRIKAL